jgi:hypothetical protein
MTRKNPRALILLPALAVLGFGLWSSATVAGGFVGEAPASAALASASRPADTTPEPFWFSDREGVEPGAVVISEEIVAAGIDAAVLIEIENGDYSIDGAAFTTAAGAVYGGQTIRVRHAAAPRPGASRVTRLRIGGVAGPGTLGFSALGAP